MKTFKSLVRHQKATCLAVAMLLSLIVRGSAQQLYISSINVQYPIGATTDHYCENGYVGTDTNVSFVSQLNGNPLEPNDWSAKIESERPRLNNGLNVYPGGCLKLCAEITCVAESAPTTFGIDELSFEVFKFGNGSNPLDPASTPPINTVNFYNIGTCSRPGVSDPAVIKIGTFCTAWAGSYNLNGVFGKSNGIFGFRAKIKTNQVSPTAGNIVIEQTSAYPGQNQLPIKVDVVNVHSVRISTTVVGVITGVAAQPYNILYRLSKGASTTITVYSYADTDLSDPVRHIVNDAPRVGEGIPDGTLTNGDFWDGRDDVGNIMPSGTYLATIQAKASDYFGADNSYGATVYMTIDPLRVTDVAVKPLGTSTTATADIKYILTEAATVYVDIYPAGTSFSDINMSPPLVGGVNRCDGGADDLCLRHLVGQQDRRVTATTSWDGRNSSGNPVCDGDYVYALYAVLPSLKGISGLIWTAATQVGTVPVARGAVLQGITESSTILGSTPTATALDPFYFGYTPARNTSVALNIKNIDGTTIVRNVLNNGARTGEVLARDTWDGKDNAGNYVPAGQYLGELITTDSFQCSAVRTSTFTTLLSVNMFRIVDVESKPLLSGATDLASISFKMSQPMAVDLNIYPTSVAIDPAVIWPSAANPDVSSLGLPVYSVAGLRSGRVKITEYWDGHDVDGLIVPDGRYPFALVAHSTGTQTIYATDKVYGYVDVARGQIIFTDFDIVPTIPAMHNSSDSVTLPPYEIDYGITRKSSVTVEILNLDLPAKVVATVLSGQIRDRDTLYKAFWDGKGANGDFLTGGAYNVRVRAQDYLSQLAAIVTVQTTIDVFPLRIYDAAITPLTMDMPAVVGYQVSEPMKVAIKIYKPGTTFNASGQPSPSEATSLMKQIIGMRAARTLISEHWDGTDLTLARVPDGNYVFRLYASTDTGAISSIDGSIAPGAALADDIITSYISVTGNVISNDYIDPPGNLAAVSLIGNKILLTWEPSPSNSITNYNLYFDAGTGTINYASPMATMPFSATSYTTNVLVSSAAYRFVLRAVNSSGREDGNVNVVTSAALLGNTLGVRADIKVPQSGKRIKGNRVTVVAEITSGNQSQVKQVLFQYKPVSSSSWLSIPSANINSPNPDLEAPYFVHWDVDALGVIYATPYEIRALTTDIYGTEDAAAPAITIVVDPVNYDIKETALSGELQKEQKVNNSVSNTVLAADEDTTLVTKLVIPPGALNLSTMAVTLVNNPVAQPSPPEGSQDLGLSVKVNLSNNQTLLSGGKYATLSLAYNDNDNDGIVDGTSVRVDQLKMYSASNLADQWVLLPSSIDVAKKTVSGATVHFSFFAVFAGPSADLDTVRVYPVPFLPNDGQTDNGVSYRAADLNSGIIFDNLPSVVKIKIFTVSGQLVADFDTSNSLGKLQWDVKNNDGKDVATGGYIAVISSPGHKTIIKKLLVVR